MPFSSDRRTQTASDALPSRYQAGGYRSQKAGSRTCRRRGVRGCEFLGSSDDPARFSFAHGGKDGHPFPVPLKVYDETLQYLGRSVSRSRVDESEKRDSLKRLHQLQLRIESLENIEADPEQVLDWDRRHSAEFGGRTVAAVVGAPRRSYSRPQSEKRKKGSQLELF